MRQVLRAGALGRTRGIGWRGRWEGRSGWGIHVHPWLIHVNVWQKPLQYCKVISLQLIKIKKNKKVSVFSMSSSSFLPSFIFMFNLIILSLSARTDQLHFSSYVIKCCLWKSKLIGTIFSMHYNFILAFHPEAQDASPLPPHLTSEAGFSNRVEISILILPIFFLD